MKLNEAEWIVYFAVAKIFAGTAIMLYSIYSVLKNAYSLPELDIIGLLAATGFSAAYLVYYLPHIIEETRHLTHISGSVSKFAASVFQVLAVFSFVALGLYAAWAYFDPAREAIRRSERNTFSNAVNASGNKKVLLKAYVDTCKICEFNKEALAEIEKITTAEEEAARKEKTLRENAARECDRRAGNPKDVNKNKEFAGTPMFDLRGSSAKAIEWCTKAKEAFPNAPRFKYQLGRAFQAAGQDRSALDILEPLTSIPYAAAFDNIGRIYLNAGDQEKSASYFQPGATLGDPDSMMSLAQTYEKKENEKKANNEQALYWYNRAANSGHPAAPEAIKRMEAECGWWSHLTNQC
jgi:hypothetical protein